MDSHVTCPDQPNRNGTAKNDPAANAIRTPNIIDDDAERKEKTISTLTITAGMFHVLNPSVSGADDDDESKAG